MNVKVADLDFETLISAAELQSRISSLGEQLNRDYAGKTRFF